MTRRRGPSDLERAILLYLGMFDHGYQYQITQFLRLQYPRFRDLNRSSTAYAWARLKQERLIRVKKQGRWQMGEITAKGRKALEEK